MGATERPIVHFEHPADAPGDSGIEVSSDPDAAEAWVVREPPRRWPERIAVITLAPPTGAWIAAPPDHHVPADVFAADPAGAVGEAVARRVVFRPGRADPADAWLAAAKRVVDADFALWSGDPELRARGRTAATGAHADRCLAGADGVFVAPVVRMAADGVVVLGVRADGAGWLDRHGATLRAACAALTRRGLVARLADRQRDVDAVRAMLGIVEHDLRGARFGLDLGARLLRRSGAGAIADNVSSSVGGPLQAVGRLLGGLRRWIDRPSPGPSGAVPLVGLWARAVAELHAAHPGRTAALGSAPTVSVAVDEGALAAVLAAVLDNAVRHGEPDSVRVTWREAADRVVLSVRNRGRLPFDDLAGLVPFRFRSEGTAGVGLCLARHAASVAGIGLAVGQDGPEVAAEVSIRVSAPG